MANDFYTPEQVAALALALVTDDIAIAATFNRDYEDDFGGGRGHSVNVKVPTALKARNRDLDDVTNKIVLDSLTETVRPISLSTHAYSAVGMSEKDMSLDLENFGKQVLAPQALGVAEDIEDTAVAALQAVTETTSIAYSATNPDKTFVAVRKVLRDSGLPASGLYAAMGTQIYADLLDADLIKDTSKSGSTEALREASVGRLRGFNLIESNRLEEDEIVFYHRASFTLAVRAPKVPSGANAGASVSSNGFAMRHIFDYDADVTQDRSVVSTFVGAANIPVFKPKPLSGSTPQDGSVLEVASAIRVLASTVPA